ncbi:MAG: hypothetical protein ACE5HC_01960 [Candidatus Binatia bacterium]
MGKILLIEPQKILRQAITLSLHPEHEVEAGDNFVSARSRALEGYDLLIVDGAALRENDQLTAEFSRAIRKCKTPTLWLEDKETSHLPTGGKLIVMKKPIDREVFQSALGRLISSQRVSRKTSRSSAKGGTKGEKPEVVHKKKTEGASPQEAFQFIDLVDVVQEQPVSSEKKTPPKKSK